MNQKKTCQICDNEAIFSFKNQKIALRCEEHKTKFMYPIVFSYCCFFQCENIINTKNFDFCSKHKEEEYQEYYSFNKCVRCNTFATHGYKAPDYCLEHRQSCPPCVYIKENEKPHEKKLIFDTDLVEKIGFDYEEFIKNNDFCNKKIKLINFLILILKKNEELHIFSRISIELIFYRLLFLLKKNLNQISNDEFKKINSIINNDAKNISLNNIIPGFSKNFYINFLSLLETVLLNKDKLRIMGFYFKNKMLFHEAIILIEKKENLSKKRILENPELPVFKKNKIEILE